MELTSKIIAHMKKTNSVVARYNGVTDLHSLDITIEDRANDITRHTLSLDMGGHIDDYRRMGKISRIDAVLLYAQTHEVWETVRNIIRPGDTLSMKWVIGNNSQTLDDAGLYHDIAYLVISRPTKRLTKRFHIALANEVAKHNSGRMIKYHAPGDM